MKRLRIFYGFLLLSLLMGCVSNTARINENINILKKQEKEIDQLDNVSARKYVSVYFDLYIR